MSHYVRYKRPCRIIDLELCQVRAINHREEDWCGWTIQWDSFFATDVIWVSPSSIHTVCEGREWEWCVLIFDNFVEWERLVCNYSRPARIYEVYIETEYIREHVGRVWTCDCTLEMISPQAEQRQPVTKVWCRVGNWEVGGIVDLEYVGHSRGNVD